MALVLPKTINMFLNGRVLSFSMIDMVSVSDVSHAHIVPSIDVKLDALGRYMSENLSGKG